MTPVNASLLRRLGAMLYDSLLVIALLMLMTTVFVIAQGGEAVEPYTLPHQLSSLAVVYGFYVFFWSYGGQTLGMRAWRMRLETDAGNIPSVAIASLRFAVAVLSLAALGLGFLWQLWDKDDLTWHDRLSGTRLRYYPKG